MHNNILKNVRSAFSVLLTLACLFFSSVNIAVAEESSNYSYTTVTNGVTIGGKQYPIRTLTANGSAAYKPQTFGEKASSVFNYEVKQAEKAWGQLKSGDISGSLKTFRGMIGDGLGGVIDAVSAGVDAVFDGVDTVLDAVSDVPVLGFISDYTLKPLASVGKFLTKGALTLIDGFKNLIFGESNLECRQDKMDNIYKSGCYPCKVVKSLISAFLNGCSFLEDISKEAGKKILLLCTILWLVFYVLKQISSFKNIEPASMVNDMLIMAFKVLGAWLVIVLGYSVVVDYVLVPFLGWGIDFGTYLLTASTMATGLDISGTQVDPSYLLTEKSGILPAHLLNNLMTYVAAVDGTVTNHMKLGHMISCHATHAGSWNIGILIPNFWILLCGLAIWFAGFMMTLSILYYLIDMSFKLGFALIALPIVTALWPFDITRGKFTACIRIILNAAGIFIFLAMTTAVGLVLVDSAIAAGMLADSGASTEAILNPIDRNAGLTELYTAIENGDTEKVSDTFLLWGSGFLLIMFAYLFAIKIIGSTLTDYVDKFFSDDIFGGVSPMHHRLTQATDMAKQKLFVEPALFAKDVAKHQGKQFLGGMANGFRSISSQNRNKSEDGGVMEKAEGFSKSIDNLQKGNFDGAETEQRQNGNALKSMANLEAKDGEKLNKEAAGGKSDGSNAATQAMEAAGDGLTEAGQAMKDAANSVQQAGKAIDAAGTAGAVVSFGTTKVASTAARAGTETSAAAVKAGAEAMILAGKTLKQTAKVMKKVNKAAKQAGKAMKKASKVAQKAMKNINNQMNKSSGGNEQQNNENQNQDDLIGGMVSASTGAKNSNNEEK